MADNVDFVQELDIANRQFRKDTITFEFYMRLDYDTKYLMRKLRNTNEIPLLIQNGLTIGTTSKNLICIGEVFDPCSHQVSTKNIS